MMNFYFLKFDFKDGYFFLKLFKYVCGENF